MFDLSVIVQRGRKGFVAGIIERCSQWRLGWKQSQRI